MKKEITLRTLAERYRRFSNWDRDDLDESYNIIYNDNSSVGNRYRSWSGVWAYQNTDGSDGKVLKKEELYEKVKFGPCDWGKLFDGLHYGFIVGPETLCAVEECLEILRNDDPPADDGTKVRHVNRLGGVNYISKPTYHDWTLQDRLSKILSEAFFADRRNQLLYSMAWTYVYQSYSGWSRSC